MPNKLLKMCARKIRQNAFSFALLIVSNLKTEGIFTKSRAYLDCEPYESPKQMPKCFRDFVSKSAKKIHFSGIFIGRYDLPPIIARDEWRNRGFGNPKPVGNLHRPVFSQLAKYLRSPRKYINVLRRHTSSFPHTHHIQNGLHRFLFHRLGRRPQGVQGPGTCSRTPPRASTRARRAFSGVFSSAASRTFRDRVLSSPSYLERV